jgi:hypothetical protein
MAQNYDPLTADRTFAASYLTLNSSDEALRTLFAGPTEPSVHVAYQLWADTTAGLMKQRNATDTAWVTLFQIGVTNGGLLPTSGGTMSGAIAMAGSKITDLGAPTAANDAVRKAEMDLKAPILSPAFSTDATLNADPVSGNSLTRKSFTEATYLKKAGDSMTGALNLAGNATADLHAVPRQQLGPYVNFNTSTGHRHDGTDARKVRATDLDSGAATSTNRLKANGTGGTVWADPSNPLVMITTPIVLVDAFPAPTSYETINLGPSGLALVPSGGKVALLAIEAFDECIVRVRPLGAVDDGAGMNMAVPHNQADPFGRVVHVGLDSSQRFEWKRVSGAGTHIIVKLHGWFQV